MLSSLPSSLLAHISQPFSFLTNSPIYQNDTTRVALFAIGAFVTLKTAFSFTKSILYPFSRPKRDLAVRYGKNTWAVITGASSGIGEAFAYELARRGFNIVLVGRNEETLTKVAQEISQTCPLVQTRVVIADFSRSHEEGFAENIYKQVQGLDVSILVNNAGISEKNYFHKMSMSRVSEMVLTNMLSHSLVIRIFLPDLAARKNKSAIINISSLSCASPKPFVALYSASKMFHDYLSRGLEYEHPNIDMISMKPGSVSSRMNNYRKPNSKTISREDFVNVTLSELGRKSHSYGHWKHKLDAFIIDSYPKFTKSMAINYFKGRYNMK